MARVGMTGWSDIVDTLEQNLSSVGVDKLGNVFLSEEVARFIVSQINTDKGIDFLLFVKPFKAFDEYYFEFSSQNKEIILFWTKV